MKRQHTMTVLTTALLCLACWTPGAVAQEGGEPPIPEERPWEVIEVAFALDTSHTMDDLIDAVRLNLWEIVYDLTLMEPTPTLRVALLTFGSPWNGVERGSVKVETDLTEDLDVVSNRLFALRTGGGDEYVARVLQVALEELSWTESEDALKFVFVAGNEEADQDPEVSLEEVGEGARLKGAFVQTLYCGKADDDDAPGWQALAQLAEGRFAAIDFRRSAAMLKSPFDEELAGLGDAMNPTFMPLGEAGAKRLKAMEKQDQQARELSLTLAASRAQAKGSRLYSASWDLGDLLESGELSLEELNRDDLPRGLSEMPPEELEAHIESVRHERAGLRQQIADLAYQRRLYLAEQREAEGVDTSNTFDAVVRQTIREKAEEKGFFLPGG